MREHAPFEWRANAEFKKRYEEPLGMLTVDPKAFGPGRRKIYLEFSRDEDVASVQNEFEAAKNRKRAICIGNCRLLDTKIEKPGTYEINPPVSLNLI
jgi:hypothetical protein